MEVTIQEFKGILYDLLGFFKLFEKRYCSNRRGIILILHSFHSLDSMSVTPPNLIIHIIM